MDRLRDLSGVDRELDAAEQEQLGNLKTLCAKFDHAMDDDFNTADAVSAIFEMVRLANIKAGADSSRAFIKHVEKTIGEYCDILGIIVQRETQLLDGDVEALIQERQAARKAKNFARADEIRQQLLEQGIILEDTREGVKWKRA